MRLVYDPDKDSARHSARRRERLRIEGDGGPMCLVREDVGLRATDFEVLDKFEIDDVDEARWLVAALTDLLTRHGHSLDGPAPVSETKPRTRTRKKKGQVAA